jgi:hypothetical protein
MEILDDCDGHAMLFQNENINNGTHTSCDYIKAGADVGKGNGVGNATVLSNSSVAFKAYDFISLEPGFVVEPGATFEASIFEVTNCSGNRFAATSSTGTNKGKSNSNYVTNASVTLQDATAQVTRSGLKMLLQPNPAQESTSIYYTVTKASEVSISIRNMYGSESLYPSSTQYKQTGEYVEEIPTSHLPKGVYIVTLHTTEGSMSKRLIIQ